MDTYLKHPGDDLDYGFDWTKLLGDDTIQESTMSVPDGLVEGDSDHDNMTSFVWLSGGTEGETYQVTNRIVTAGGRAIHRSMRIQITDR